MFELITISYANLAVIDRSMINASANRTVVERSSDLGNLMELLMVLQEINPEMTYDIVEVEEV